MTKAELRKELKEKRKAISAEDRTLASKLIAASVSKMYDFMGADLILSYLPIQNEVDTCYLQEEAQKLGKPIAIPRVDGDDMDFYLLEDSTKLKESAFHVLEPTGQDCVDYSAYKHMVMLVPGVGFDESSHRIGYGKGFYDRFLLRMQKEFPKQKLVTIGFAYDCQLVDKLPSEAHDQKLDYIATPTRLIGV